MFIYDDVMQYFKHGRRFMYYKNCCSKADDFAPHADGVYPQELIECRRPNEREEVKEYRCKIWKPKTKPAFSKIVASLGKIRRSSDWSIKFPPASDFPLIAESESLEDYTEKNYPYFTSLTNWIFSVLLKKYLIDPNAVILVRPLEWPEDNQTYLRPFAEIFASCHVIEYIEGESAILEIAEGCWYQAGRSRQQVKGRSYYAINKTVIERWDQISTKEDFSIVASYPHNLAMLPVFKIGAIICEADGSNFLYESRISGVLPDFDEALREYSDLQAAKVLHIFPERWEFTQNECTDCKGTGRRSNPTGGEPYVCQLCSGRGYVAAGPYSKLLFRPTNAIEGQQPVPNPPVGYVEKDVEIVKVMEASVKQHIYDGLASINFQFLEQVPLSQSGTAKEVDKEELNNTVHAIAEDLVRIMDSIYKLIAWYRYGTLYPNPEDLKRMVPSVPVPEHFDLLSSQFMQTEVDSAKKANLNPVITSAMEVEYAGKRFVNEPEVRDRLSLVLQLDPLPNITEDAKMSMLSNKGITLSTYIISSNIQSFVQRAIDEDNKFAEKPLTEQKKKMQQYGNEQIAAQMAAVGNPDQPIEGEDANQDIEAALQIIGQRLSTTGNGSEIERMRRLLQQTGGLPAEV